MNGYPDFREISRQAQQAAEDVFGLNFTCFINGSTDAVRDVRARLHTTEISPELEDSSGTAVIKEIKPRLIFCVQDANSYMPKEGDVYALSKIEMYRAKTKLTRFGVYAPIQCVRLTSADQMKKYLPFLG